MVAASSPPFAPPSTSSVAVSPTSSDRIAAVCSAWVDFATAAVRELLSAQLDPALPSRFRPSSKDFWSAQQPVSGLDATRPRPIKADLEKLRAPAQRGAATGDPATLTSPDLQTTERSIDQSVLRACGYQYLQITATDAVYHGVAPQRQRAVR
jgi:hypothetical protein